MFIQMLLVLLVLLAWKEVDSSAIINSLSFDFRPNYVLQTSWRGGGMLYIGGSGFNIQVILQNKITLQGKTCSLIVSKCTEYQLVCTTSPLEIGFTPVVVTVNGKEAQCNIENNAYCGVWVIKDRDYMIRAANPPAMDSRNTYFFLEIDSRDYAPTTLGAVSYFASGIYYIPNTRSRLRQYLSAANIQGVYNISNSDLVIANSGYFYLANGTQYHLASVPIVGSMSSHLGSRMGQVITINGAGFSSIPSQNAVSFNGLSCAMINSAFHQITCELPQDLVGLGSSLPPYLGNAGVEIYKTTIAVMDYSQQRTNPIFKSSLLPFDVQASTELRLSDSSSDNTLVMRSFFCPSQSGDYQFLISGAAYTELWLDSTHMSTSNLQLIAQDWGSGFRDFYFERSTGTFPNLKQSSPIALNQGECYLFELMMTGARSPDYLSMGAILHLPTPSQRRNTVTDIYRIKVTHPKEIVQVNISSATLSGQWALIIDGITTSALQVGCLPQTLCIAIKQATHLDVLCSLEMYDASGNIVTDKTLAQEFSYSITFWSRRFTSNVPVLQDISLDPSASFNVEIIANRAGSGLGFFTLDVQGATVTLHTNTTLDNFYYQLVSNTPCSPAVKIRSYYNYIDGSEWWLYFEESGVQPLISLHSTAFYSPETTMTVERVRSANDSQEMMMPLTFDHLWTYNQKPQVKVKTLGISAICNFSCSYEYENDPLRVPLLTSYDLMGTQLQMQMQNMQDFMAENITVEFGDSLCSDYVLSGPFLLICSLPEDSYTISASIAAGRFLPRIHFTKLGYSLVDPTATLTTIVPVITTVDPLMGSSGGGFLLTVNGQYFRGQLTELSSIQVSIGSSPCVVQSASFSTITCMTGPSIDTNTITVTVNDQTGNYFGFSYDPASTISITGITPNTIGPLQTTTITVTGTNFGTISASMSVYLLSNSDSATQYPLQVLSSDTVSLNAMITSYLPVGSYQLVIENAGFGRAAEASPGISNFLVAFEIEAVLPNSGSIIGGTVIEIKGSYFPQDLTTLSVTIGDSGVKCDQIAATAVGIQCTTNDISAIVDTPLEVIVSLNTGEVATCAATPSSVCSFTFSTAHTSTVNWISQTSGAYGDIIILTGQNIGSSISVLLSGSPCPILYSDSTSIQFSVPDLIASEYVLTVIDNANGAVELNINQDFTVLMTITSVLPTQGSVNGAIFEIQGTGFGSPIVNDGSCIVESFTTTKINCRLYADLSSSSDVPFVVSSMNQAKVVNGTWSSYTPQSTLTATIANMAVIGIPSISGSFDLSFTGTQLDLSTEKVVILVSVNNPSLTYQESIASLSPTSFQISFSNVPAGSFKVLVHLDSIGFAQFDSVVSNTIALSITLQTIVPFTSSYAGGKNFLLTATGPDLPNDLNLISLKVCGFEAPLINMDAQNLFVKTPQVVTPLTLGLLKPNQSTQIRPTSYFCYDLSQCGATIDEDINTYFVGDSDGCSFGYDFDKSMILQLSSVDFHLRFPYESTAYTNPIKNYYNLTFEGSNDNVTYTEVFKLGSFIKEGWNTWINSSSTSSSYFSSPSTQAFRYYRFSSPLRKGCEIAEVRFFGVKLYSEGHSDINSLSCDVELIVNSQSQAVIPSVVNYELSETTIMTSLSPRYGSVAGGTLLTIKGERFPPSAGSISISIDGQPCASVSVVSATEITCVTGPAKPRNLRSSPLAGGLVTGTVVNGNIGGTSAIQFFYVESWSDSTTWTPLPMPLQGSSVVIDGPWVLLVDLPSISISQIAIKNGGGIIFKDQDSTFKSKNFTIEYGYLAIGWEDSPFKSKLNIIFDSPCSAESSSTCPPYGLTMQSGFMSIQGVPRLRYMTELALSAWGTQSVVWLADQVDWVSGEEVLISSTTIQLYSYYASENLTIASATNVSTLTALTLNTPLQYLHLIDSSTCNTRTHKIVPKVALLSRNILISGTYSSFTQNSGPSLRLQGFNRNGRENVVFKISSVSFQYCGAAGTLGSCILIDSILSRGASYFKNSVIRESSNRGITLASVQNLILQSNTIFNVSGHGLALGNGDEFQNILDSNLVCKVKTSQTIAPSDFFPAGILLSSPSNVITNNRIVDVLSYGISFQLPYYPTGNLATVTFCPQGMPLLKFDNNIINSIGGDGINFGNYVPRSLPCELPWTPGNYPLPNMQVSNTIVWVALGDGIQLGAAGAINFTNLFVDYVSDFGFYFQRPQWYRNVTVGVYNSTFQGRSPCTNCDPSGGFAQPPWDGFQLTNTSFCEWKINTPAIVVNAQGFTGGKMLVSSQLVFENALNKLSFGASSTNIIADTDSSLHDALNSTSSGGGTYYYTSLKNYTLNASGCWQVPGPTSSLQCHTPSKPRRVMIQPLATTPPEHVTLMSIGRINDWAHDNKTFQAYYDDSIAVTANTYDLQDPLNVNLTAVALATGYVYTISLTNAEYFDGFYIKGSDFTQANDRPITLRFDLASGFRPSFAVSYTINATSTSLLQQNMWDPQDSQIEDGIYYFDEIENHLYFARCGNKPKGSSVIQIISQYTCNSTCKTCNGPTGNNCLSCYSGYFLNVDSSCSNASDGISFVLSDTNDTSVYLIVFSMLNQNLAIDMLRYLSLSINETGLLNNSEYVMRVLYNGTVRVQLTMNDSIPGGSLLKAEFDVTQTSDWTLINTYATITMKEYVPITFNSPDAQPTPPPSLGQLVGDIADAANFVAVIPLAAQSLLRVGDNTIARMSNLMDLVNYLRFLNINYPQMVEDLFIATSGVNMDINFYVNIFGGIAYEYPEDELKGPIYSRNPKFEDYHVQPCFTYNFGQKLTTGLIMLIVVIILSQILHYKKRMNGTVIKIASFALEYLKGSVLLMAYLSYQIDLSVATFFQTFYLKSSFGEVVNEILSFVGLFLGFIAPTYAFYICLKIRKYMKTHSNLDRAEEKFKWVFMAFRELKDQKLPQLMMLPLFITRSVIFSLIVVYLYNYPLVQGVLNFTISLCYTSYIWYYRPLAEEKDLYPEVFQQSIYLVLSTCVMMLGIDDKYDGWAPDSNVKSTLRVVVGWVIVTMCFMMVLTYYYMSLLSAWKLLDEVYTRVKAFREKRRAHRKRLERREISTAARAKELMLIDNMDEIKDTKTAPLAKSTHYDINLSSFSEIPTSNESPLKDPVIFRKKSSQTTERDSSESSFTVQNSLSNRRVATNRSQTESFLIQVKKRTRSQKMASTILVKQDTEELPSANTPTDFSHSPEKSIVTHRDENPVLLSIRTLEPAPLQSPILPQCHRTMSYNIGSPETMRLSTGRKSDNPTEIERNIESPPQHDSSQISNDFDSPDYFTLHGPNSNEERSQNSSPNKFTIDQSPILHLSKEFLTRKQNLKSINLMRNNGRRYSVQSLFSQRTPKAKSPLRFGQDVPPLDLNSIDGCRKASNEEPELEAEFKENPGNVFFGKPEESNGFDFKESHHGLTQVNDSEHLDKLQLPEDREQNKPSSTPSLFEENQQISRGNPIEILAINPKKLEIIPNFPLRIISRKPHQRIGSFQSLDKKDEHDDKEFPGTITPENPKRLRKISERKIVFDF